MNDREKIGKGELCRMLIEKTDMGYVTVDRDGRVMDANKAYLRFTGYFDLDEIRGRSVLEWTAEYEKKKNTLALEQCVRDGYIRNLQIDYVDRTGKVISVEINAAAAIIDGAPQILALCRDITKRRKMEELLSKLIADQQTILDSSPAMIFYKDKDNRFVLVNETLARAEKLSKEEMEQKTLWDIYPKEIADHYWEDDREVMASGKPKKGIIELLPTKDGAKWVRTDKIPYYDKDGKILGIIGFSIDITDLKETEEALKKSEEDYRTIFESASDAIIICDIDTRNMLNANNKACEMFRCGKDELIDFPFDNLLASSIQCPGEKIKYFYDESVKGRPQLFECLSRDKFGRQFWIEMNIKRAVIAGQDRLICIARDATERRHLMDQKNSFINTISHELRIPLCAIRESVSLMLEGRIGAVNEEQRGALEITKKNTDRLNHFINQVLDFQKMKSSMVEFKFEENQMNGLIEEICSGMMPLADKKKIDVVLRLHKDLPSVKFDRDKIGQVMSNLVSNAIKFTEKGSVTVTTQCGENVIQISIADTGPGIREEDMPKLFQQFAQLVRTPGGTGLGLAICKEIIDKHKGKIWAESKLGEGTVFHFILPIKERRRQ